jgi:ABC-type amino acid transport system permease subunit
MIASIAMTKIHEEIEFHWPWLLASIALTMVASVVGLVLSPIAGLVVGLFLALVGIPVRLRARTRVREITHSGA